MTVVDSPLAGVIFDIGGTLIYPTTTDADCIRHLSAWLRVQGWPAAIDEAVTEARRWILHATAETGRQHTMHQAIRRALDRTGRPAPDDAFVHAAEQRFFAPELDGYRPFPHARALLQRLHRAGLRAACISNATSHWLIEQIVHRMGFGPYLNPVVSSAGFGRTKPDPGIFRDVLRRWNLEPARVAMVGDTLAADIAGGIGAGMRTLYVTMAPNPDNVRHLPVHPDAEAATLADAERILLGWAAQ
jgi:HAD superfamily hydrolase (TIGR01509 family)